MKFARYVNYFVVASDNLTDSSEEELAYHPTRLMGIEDILNAVCATDTLFHISKYIHANFMLHKIVA